MLYLVQAAAAKAAIILAIAGLVNVSWRSASAAARHLVWTLAVTAALAIPAIGVAISSFNAPHIEVPVWSAPAPMLAPHPAAEPIVQTASPEAPSIIAAHNDNSIIEKAASEIAAPVVT